VNPVVAAVVVAFVVAVLRFVFAALRFVAVLVVVELNDLFDKAIQYINKINEIFLESVKLIASMYEQYKAYIDNFQRTNQQWIESQWSPFLAKAKVEETEKIAGRKKG
jgi:predicted PurR-regulated permease PerM